MTDNDTIIPGHRDRVNALRVVLAMLAGDFDDVAQVAAEAHTARDVDRFFAAAVDCFTRVLTRRHPDPAGHLDGWIAYELAQPDTDGVEESVVPSHADRARALCTVLAAVQGDSGSVARVAGEPTTERGVDRLLLALCDCLQAFITGRTKDPVGYVESWITVELLLAEQAGE